MASSRTERPSGVGLGRRLVRLARRSVAVVLAAAILVGALALGVERGWLSLFGFETESHDSQIVDAVERTQEVSLVSLSIQGLKSETKSAKVLGKTVPLTGETVYIEYKFRAKLGIDGGKVRIQKTGTDSYAVSVPKFTFIGYDDPTFKLATQDGSPFSVLTPDIDKVEMVDDILNSDAKAMYIDSNRDVLEDQSKFFYSSLIASVDPAVKVSFTFDPT